MLASRLQEILHQDGGGQSVLFRLCITLPYNPTHRSKPEHNADRGGFFTSQAETSGSTNYKVVGSNTYNQQKGQSTFQFWLLIKSEEIAETK